MRRLLISGVLWGILGFAVPTWADPVRVVSQGSIGGNDDSYSFYLNGNGFQVSGEGPFITGPWTQCSIGASCPAGTSLDLSATVVPSPIADPATIDGTRYEGYNYYDGVFMSGSFAIDAGAITVPVVAPGTLAFATTPFTFTGLLRGYDNFELTGTPLFSLNLTGRGTATFEFSDYLGGSTSRLTYEFESPAPTPEPATLLLIGSGLAGLVVRRRRARPTLFDGIHGADDSSGE